MFFSGSLEVVDGVPAGELVLAGPRPVTDPLRLPLRGDLAHVKLAGRCFVPHYAVPLHFRVVGGEGATLHLAPGADPAAWLAVGSRFDVLDIAGAWAWGQAVEAPIADGVPEGLVGYVPLVCLEPA